ncbi:hypothetical protein HMPREF1210_01178 [Paenisporosarcina sp. HGH0030]|uniref:ReoY family proteolytic degradation factor n=1 Tax=Paenisporosarcina sp. HGH0030 TaxID=1078085 RepID=UPI00034E69FC|nr:ReoY family proteolytic degradation factor [Paenisporosarcina sp. HGH0030]EPD52798.1 hypothetical protein HMPREF1210_01178 [Paenisporosarcina sp. HGH0030]
MNSTVSVEDKKVFVRWLLKRYQMKRAECKWILSYLLTHDEIMKNVHFVEEAHYCPRAMVMSVSESNGVPFRFYKGELMTANAEKAFHDMRLNPEEDMYLQLNFPQTNELEYLNVLETNAFIPKYLQINYKDREFAEQVTQHLVKAQAEFSYEQMIDEALDKGDKDRFMELTQKVVQSI